MSGWEAQRVQARRPPQYERNFTCTEIELFCGTRGAAFKKVRKDKRESNSRLEDPPHRLKERPSWLSISRQPSSSFAPSSTWRQAICNLLDEEGQATLRLYTDDQHLHYSIHVNASFAPHIRIIDPSLHSRRHVLAIYDPSPTIAAVSSSNTTNASTATYEPVYLAFRSRDTLNSWLVLLRSFARPDLRPDPYPVGCAFPQNINYRIWRHLQITILGGRKFGNRHIFGGGSSDESNFKDSGESANDTVKWEGMLEAVLNGVVVGRTSVKTLPGPPWSTERITVTDPYLGSGTWAGSNGAESTDSSVFIPETMWGGGPQGTTSAFLEIRGLRFKSGLFTGAPTVLPTGTVPVDLGAFRRGEVVRGWWPGFSPPGTVEQNGELLMEIKFDEEVVLPLEMYATMKDILVQRNYFELWNDLTTRIPIPMPVSTHLISLALYHGNLGPHLAALAHAEIHNTNTSPSTLFRGNSMFTRLTESAMAMLGAQGFLESSIGRIVRGVYRDRVIFETNSSGPGEINSAAGIVEGADLMAYWLQQLWDSIWKARDGCPNELRHLFHHIRTQVEARWGSSALHADLKYQAISAFLFLRFFIPALLRPEQHGLVVGPPPEGVERSLKSLARVLQSLANLNTNVQREEFMRSVKSFNEDNVDAMIDYLTFVSTPLKRRPVIHSVPPTLSSSHSHAPQAHLGAPQDLPPELQIRTALQARLPSMAALHRESLPVLPYMTDEARDFAVIASAVVRNSRTPSGVVQSLHREIGPMNEGLEGLASGGLGVSNADIGDEQSGEAAEARRRNEPEVPLDVIRFIKACFDVQAETMRRVSPNATLKKHGRRRRRPTKQGDNPNSDPPEQPIPETRTPSVEGSSYDGQLGVGSPVSLASGAGVNAGPGSTGSDGASLAPVDLSARPDIVRQSSQNAEAKKKKGVLRFFPGGSRNFR